MNQYHMTSGRVIQSCSQLFSWANQTYSESHFNPQLPHFIFTSYKCVYKVRLCFHWIDTATSWIKLHVLVVAEKIQFYSDILWFYITQLKIDGEASWHTASYHHQSSPSNYVKRKQKHIVDFVLTVWLLVLCSVDVYFIKSYKVRHMFFFPCYTCLPQTVVQDTLKHTLSLF